MRLSPGFKQEAKTVLFYVAILAVFVYALGTKTDALKKELNTAIQIQCIANAPQTSAIFKKYNDVVASLVAHERVSEKKDLKDGLGSNAANDAALLARLKADEIAFTQPNCDVPFLR